MYDGSATGPGLPGRLDTPRSGPGHPARRHWPVLTAVLEAPRDLIHLSSNSRLPAMAELAGDSFGRGSQRSRRAGDGGHDHDGSGPGTHVPSAGEARSVPLCLLWGRGAEPSKWNGPITRFIKRWDEPPLTRWRAFRVTGWGLARTTAPCQPQSRPEG